MPIFFFVKIVGLSRILPFSFTIFPFCLFFRLTFIVSKQRKRLRSETFFLPLLGLILPVCTSSFLTVRSFFLLFLV